MAIELKVAEIKSKIKQRGEVAMENVRKGIVTKYNDGSSIAQALTYFATVTLDNALPVFPALISIACEAVEGKLEYITPFSEAIVFISTAADLHDDIIDHSTKKKNKLTVLGKFGSTITILAGDILLVEGFKKLSEACNEIPLEKSKEIMKIVSDAVFEICSAEALESKLHSKSNIAPKKYEEIIRLKAVVPELTMKIGAIVGNKKTEYIEKLGQFGRSYGTISVIVEEFADLLEINELRNRIKNECPPLPILYALQDKKIRRILKPLINSEEINKSIHGQIVNIILESKDVVRLQKTIISDARITIQNLPSINGRIKEELESMLLVPLTYFE